MVEEAVGKEEAALWEILEEHPPYPEGHPYAVSLDVIKRRFNRRWQEDFGGEGELPLRVEGGGQVISFFIGAQPGAGKSAQLSLTTEEQKGDVIVVDGDDYRAIHPQVEELEKLGGDAYVQNTGPLSSTFIRLMIARSLDQHCNIIIEGTMRNPDVVKSTMEMCKRNEYTAEARIVAVSNVASYIGTHYRYEEMLERGGVVARSVADEIHSSSYNTIPVLLEDLMNPESPRLLDRVQVFNRAGKKLSEATYNEESREFEINPEFGCHPLEALSGERVRESSAEEERTLGDQVRFIKTKRTERGGTQDPSSVESLEYFNIGLDREMKKLEEQRARVVEGASFAEREEGRAASSVSEKKSR